MTAYEQLQNLYKATEAKDPWAVAWAIVTDYTYDDKGEKVPRKIGPKLAAVKELYADEIASAEGDGKAMRSLAGRIAGGIEQNPWNKSMDGETIQILPNEEKSIQKLGSGAVGALAGWWLGGTIQDITRGMGQPTPAQQREFERQIQQAMRKKGRKISKDTAMEKMQTFFQNDENDTYVRRTPVKNAIVADEDLQKQKMSFPPFAGAKFDPTSHRWTKPENYGQTYAARGGKKRIRGSGTGVHERSVSGHGKGRIRGEGLGRKYKGDTDLAATRRKEGFTHGTKQK